MPSIFDYGFSKLLNKLPASLYTPAVYDSLGQMIDQNQVIGLKTTLDGISTTFDATIGATGANYQTIGLAVAAGKTRLLVIDNTTETGNIAPSGNLLIYIEAGKKVNMGSNRFRIPGAKYLDIKGDAGAEIEWAMAEGSLYVFEALQTSSILHLDGLILDNNSTADDASVFQDIIATVTNCEIQLPNQAACGLTVSMAKCFIQNIVLTGGGTSCSRGIWLTGVTGSQASQIYVDGTWNSTSTTAAIVVGSATMSDVVFNHATNATQIEVDADGVVTNVFNNASQVLHLRINGNDVVCGDIDLNSDGEVRLDAADRCRLSNVKTTGDLLDVAANDNGEFANCRFGLVSTIDGDRHKFTGCEFIAGATVAGGADNNGFVNCQFGADAGGGAATITINTGANNTRVVSCMTDAAISDSGTGTVTAANVVY